MNNHMKVFLSKLKIVFALFIILLLSVAVFKAGYHFYLLRKNLKKYSFQLSSLKERNKNIKREISYLNNPYNLEVEARRQMNLFRKGEKVIVILPQEKTTSSPVRDKGSFSGFNLREVIRKVFRFLGLR